MSITPFCTQQDVEALLSIWGVELRIDDEDGSLENDWMDAMLQKATADVNFYLAPLYAPAQLRTADWVKWATAVFAAVAISRRRGNAPSAELYREYEEYRERLTDISRGDALIPADSEAGGFVAPTEDVLPGYSNVRIDSRFRQPIRRIEETSTFQPQNDTRKSFTFPWNRIYWW